MSVELSTDSVGWGGGGVRESVCVRECVCVCERVCVYV